MKSSQAGDFKAIRTHPARPLASGLENITIIKAPCNGLAPRVAAGEIVAIDPGRAAQAGDDVFIRWRGYEQGRLARLVCRCAGGAVIGGLRGQPLTKVERGQCLEIVRVISISRLIIQGHSKM